MKRLGAMIFHPHCMVSGLSLPFRALPKKFYSTQTPDPRVCVVGGGPAGFGIAQYLLNNHTAIKVHMVEKSPVPYGLIRYGVSPDHQDVKNCIHGYEKVADNQRFSYFGNVCLGDVVSLNALIENYHAVVLCTGAQGPMNLGIPGEGLDNVFSSKEFVGWYNGVPEYQHITPDLSGKTAAIIGVGNVALDCARMLLKPPDLLKETDITMDAYEALLRSKISNVAIVGRRGPLQMACTRRELSEITELGDVKTVVDPGYFTEEVKAALDVKNLKRRRIQRLVKYLMRVVENSSTELATKEFSLKLLRTPLEITGDKTVKSVLTRKNSMSGSDGFNPKISPTCETEEIDCDLVISCIGYKNPPVDPSLPFEDGKMITDNGRVETPAPIYACGWCKTGPKGVLADTVNDCLVTGNKILEDIDTLTSRNVKPDELLLDNLRNSGSKIFSWQHWGVIDRHEIEAGESVGKIRDKLTTYEDMAKVAFG